MSRRNFYEILKSTPEASVDELRRNYKQLILQCHPDKLPHTVQEDVSESSTSPTFGANTVIDNTSAVNNIEADSVGITRNAFDPKISAPKSAHKYHEFLTINEAWNTLKDPAKRRLYDANLLLTKFETHNNIFARLRLDDMELCAGAASRSGSDSGEDSDHAQSKTHELPAAETAKSDKIHWYYTYNCRCGGQYILDESADSEILDRKRMRPGARNHNNKQNHGLDNGNDNNCTGSDVGAGTKVGNVASNVSNVEGDQESNVAGEDDNDIDGDVIVECSECSLVIVLT